MNFQESKVNQRNMENSAETSPLLNEYKKVYFFERFIQTIFGGPVVKTSSDTGKVCLPFYLHIYQFIVFILPLVLSAVFTAITEVHPGINYWMSISFGCIMTVIMIIILVCRNLSAKQINSSSNLADDGDETEFEGCCGIKQLLIFMINKKKWAPNLVIHSLLYGVVNGIVFLYLLPSTVNRQAVFQSKTASIVYYVISWLSSCVGVYGLIAKPPAEPCQFRTTDHYEILVLTRPFYMCIFGVVGILAMFYDSLSVIDLVMRIIFPCLPVLWTLGILPPIDCFFAWLGEQALVHLFGGSPMVNNLRLLLMLVLFGIFWLVMYSTTDQTVALTLGAFFGFLLSADVASGCSQVINYIYSKIKANSVDCSRPISTASYSWSKKFYFFVVITAVVLISTMTNIFILDKKKESLLDVIGYIIISLFVIQRLFGSFLTSYLFFGSVNNPLFLILRKSKGKTFVMFLRKILANCVVPFLLVTFVTLSAGMMVGNAALTLFALRAYHFAWQDQHKCALDVTVLMLIRNTSVNTLYWWNNLGLHIQLFIIGLLRSRTQYAWNIISFASRFTYKFYFSRKVRHQSYKRVAILTSITLPFFIIFTCFGIVLCAPLLPLFTLPVFLMGFPRPLKFWPHADIKVQSSSKDWIYYRQLTPSLLHCMKGLISSGSIGEVSAGEHFLARFQDRLVWITIAEKGFMYSNVIVKGLELAETSCHTIEAGRVDDLFECILGDMPRPRFNPYLAHCLLPCDVMELDTYSDARNVLTGIIDRPENLSQLSKNFIKCLTWVLLRFSKSWRDLGKGDGPTAEELRAKSEVTRRKLSVNRSPTNETAETYVITSDTVEDFLREPSLSSHDKSSSSENSYTALWSNQDGVKVFPMKSKTDNMNSFQVKDDRVLPAANIASFGKLNENKRHTEARRLNLAMKDDFDDFGFDDFDEDQPRKASRESKTRSMIDSMLDTSSSDFVDPVTYDRLPNRSTLPSIDVDLSSPHSSLVEPPLRWKQSVPVDAVEIARYQENFSEEWFRFVISQLSLEEKGDHVLKSLSADRGLLYIYRRLVIACYLVVFEQKHTARDVWKSFSGVFPWSRFSSWFECDNELYKNVLLAYRYAFKLMYDEAVLGPIDDFEEMAECLFDYENNWHMGSDDEDTWVKAVLGEIPNLASVGYNKEDGTFTSRILTRQKMAVPIGRLDSENVRAIWASLSLELLYFTNDDEERYSIQAHPSHLRNIIIQAADPPLGYPVYSSGLLSVVAW